MAFPRAHCVRGCSGFGAFQEVHSSAQADTPWYKPVKHSPENNPIPKESMGTIQIFHPKLLKILRSRLNWLPAPAPTAPLPIAGRFAGTASSSEHVTGGIAGPLQ